MKELRNIKWGVGAALMGKKQLHIGFRRGNLNDRVHFEEPDIDGNITLTQTGWDMRNQEFCDSGQGHVAGFYEHRKETEFHKMLCIS